MRYPNILHDIRPSQILHTQAHKLPWTLSQILPIIAHILSNLGFHKNTHHIEPQIYTISIKSPKALTLKENPKKKTIPIRHSYKARCYTAP